MPLFVRGYTVEVKLLILDFCGTLVPFQSADRFVWFCLSDFYKKGLFSLFRFLPGRLRKRGRLRLLVGMDGKRLRARAQEYFEQIIEPSFNRDVVLLVRKARKQKAKIWLASAGYEVYLDLVVEALGLDGVVGTGIEVVDGAVTGRILGADCVGGEKVERLKEAGVLEFEILSPDLSTGSRSGSRMTWVGVVTDDLVSDRALLDLAGRCWLVSGDKLEVYESK